MADLDQDGRLDAVICAGGAAPGRARGPDYHFHNAHRSPMHQGLAALEMSVARDKIVLNLGEETGNIWLAELEERH